MNLLMQILNYLLIVYSIDNNNALLLNNSNLDVQNNLQEDKIDFNFNDISTEDLALTTFPFINCNRNIFCISDDLIHLLKSSDIDLVKVIRRNRSEILIKLFFIENAVKILVSNDLNYKNIQDVTHKHLKKSHENPDPAKVLNDEFDKLTECIIMRRLNMIKLSTYFFLLTFEKFFDEILIFRN